MENLELKQINQETNNYVSIANRFEIINNLDYERGTEFLKGIKGLRKKVDESFKPIIKKAHASWKEAIAQSKKHSDPLDNAERIIKNKISSYILDCEKKRREEQRRLEELEKKRLEEEALKQAATAETIEEAEEIIQEAIEIKPVVIAPKIEPKVDGISSRKVFKWKMLNEKEIKREFLMADEKKINAIVRSLGKEAGNLVGGIQIYEQTLISARS